MKDTINQIVKLANRQNSLGGSDIGAILGLSKYRSAVDVWLEKTGQATSQASTLPLRFGSYAEDFVAKEYATQTGHHLAIHTETIHHPDHPYLTGHIDRFVLEPEQALWSDGVLQTKKLLECKTAHPFNQHEWGEPGSDQVPLSYLTQCAWYMMLTGCDTADLAVLFANNDFRIYTIHQDPELEAVLLDKAVHFWTHHVETRIPPAPHSDVDCRTLFQKAIPSKCVEASSDLVQQIEALKQLEEEIKLRESTISEIKTQIMSTMADAELLNYQGKTLVTWKAPKPSLKLDTKRLSAEHPELIHQYQSTVANSRRLVIKELS